MFDSALVGFQAFQGEIKRISRLGKAGEVSGPGLGQGAELGKADAKSQP